MSENEAWMVSGQAPPEGDAATTAGRAVGAAAHSGGAMSNTPPGTRQSEGMAKLVKIGRVSEDTAHISLWVNWKDSNGLYDKLRAAKKERQRNEGGALTSSDGSSTGGMTSSDGSSEGSYYGDMMWGGMIIRLCPTGAGGGRGKLYYPFKATVAGGVTYKFREEQGDASMPNFGVEFGSVALAQCGGLKGAWEILLEAIEKSGGRIVKHRLSRVDQYVDVAGVGVEEFQRRFSDGWRVCRARKASEHEVGEEVTTEFKNGTKNTGFTIGISTKLRVYDKIEELKRDLPKAQVFAEKYGGALPEVMTRVEFQMRRDASRNLNVGDGGRVDTVNEYLNYSDSIWSYLTGEWFRLTDEAPDTENRNQGRAKTWEIWEKVASAGKGENELQAVKMIPRIGPIDMPQLDRQAISCLIKSAEYQGKTIKNIDDFVEHAKISALRQGSIFMREKVAEYALEKWERLGEFGERAAGN